MLEDEWHEYTGEKTLEFLRSYLPLSTAASKWLLNAGAGVYAIRFSQCKEVLVDLFVTPIRKKPYAVCASVEKLPFSRDTFYEIVCVGEVLAYCDPAVAINEFGRVLKRSGIVVIDFCNSRSVRYWLKKSYGRAADLVTDFYNGTTERTWIYDYAYIDHLMKSAGLEVIARLGTHTWSALARRFGATMSTAVLIQRHLDRLPLPRRCADVMTIVASRSSARSEE